MSVPVCLLISATRSWHSLSLRRAAERLAVPFTTLAACENFLYPPPAHLASPLAQLFYSYPPPAELFSPPPGERELAYMIRRDALFHALIPFLEASYHAVSSSHRVGSLFLALNEIFLRREGPVLRILAPQDPVASWLLRHLFRRWWGNLKRQEVFNIRFYPPLSPDEPFAAAFEAAGGGGVYRVFFPEQEGQNCYFAFLFLYVLLERIALSFSLSLGRLASHSIIMARCPLEIAGRTEGLLAAAEAAEVLKRAGSPELVVADALVLHGPQGYITLLTSSLTDEAAYWIALKGDLVAGGETL